MDKTRLIFMLGWLISQLSGTTLSEKVELDGLGTLEGGEEVARDGSTFLAFRGVPYATPPLGIFRFRPAAQVSPWKGVLSARQPPALCIQHDYWDPTQLVGSEDCLYLNVFTKKTDAEVKKPVIFYIHGGAFIFGGSDHSPPEYIMEEDVVFVSIQYRLGPFGFLSTEDKHAPGNYGLQDQLAALRWVNEHIESFGGDPKQVTIMGISAGGASVHYLLLSPNSAGLFNRAIALSGSALCWWADLPNQRRTAKQLGASLDCSTLSTEEMVECLRGKTAEEIMEKQTDLYAWHKDKVEREPMNIWSPRSDKEAGNTAVLQIEPHLAAQVGQIQPVPFLVGVDESEGIWRAVNYLYQDEVMMEFVKDFETVAPHALGLVGQVPEGEMETILKRMKRYYLDSMQNEKDLDKRLSKVVTGMVEMLGDTMFNYPIDRMVKLHANKDYSPVWVYKFNYKHNHSIAFLDVTNGGKTRKMPDDSMKQLFRPTHAQEAAMLFPAFDKALGPLSEEETRISRKYIKFIMEFIREGVPTVEGKMEFKDWKGWKPLANGQISHQTFGKYSAAQKGLPFQERMKWLSGLPIYWKKDQVKKNEEPAPERYAEAAEIFEDDSDSVEEIVAERLTEDELDELEVNKVVGEMSRDEL